MTRKHTVTLSIYLPENLYGDTESETASLCRSVIESIGKLDWNDNPGEKTESLAYLSQRKEIALLFIREAFLFPLLSCLCSECCQ